MWAYEREIPYVVQRDGFVKHIVCLGNCQTGGQTFVHILIFIVKLSGSLGLILSDNLEQFSHKYCEHCFLFACTVYKQGFYLMVKGKKRFLKFFIEYFKRISRCPGVNSSSTVITKWFTNRLAGVCHFISQKNIKTCLAKPDQASFYMWVLVRWFTKTFNKELVFDIASLYYKKILYFTLNVPDHMFRSPPMYWLKFILWSMYRVEPLHNGHLGYRRKWPL